MSESGAMCSMPSAGGVFPWEMRALDAIDAVYAVFAVFWRPFHRADVQHTTLLCTWCYVNLLPEAANVQANKGLLM
jgi:hypothetical protein